MYHIENSQLRVCGRYIRQQRNKEVFKDSRLIILQHILSDTGELINLLVEGTAEIFAIIAKPYSIDEKIAKNITDAGLNLIRKEYKELETTDFLKQLLDSAVDKSKEDGKKILIIEVGGYFAKTLSKLSKDSLEYIAGVVEDTTFGHNRYLKLMEQIEVPIFSVARSPLKEIEAVFVGDSAVSAMNQILREIGSTISSRRGLIVGYGMIGKNIAKSLRAKNVHVNVYDKEDHKNLGAFNHGYQIHKKLELLKKCDIIFSATGTDAITLEDIENCKSGAILVSAGSKDIEFDVQGLRDLAFKTEIPAKNIEKFYLPCGNQIYLVNKGTAVNFLIKSVPDEIIDLVFSEIILCSILLLKKFKEYPLHCINTTPGTFMNEISKTWLKDINR